MIADRDRDVDVQDADSSTNPGADANDHDSLKYHLLGPSLTKAGQDSVDQQKVIATLLVTSAIMV